MGKLFKLWFKKKKQESNLHQEHDPPPTSTKLYTPTETPLNFTHGSLLDDVLKGLNDQHEQPKTKNDAPDLPLSSSVRHLNSWSKNGTVPEHENQQKQTYGNNGSNTQQPNKVSQAYCSPPPTPEAPSDSLGTPPSTKVVAPPNSASTPSSSLSLQPRLLQYDTGLTTPPSPTNDQVDDSGESSSSPVTIESNEYYHQPQKSKTATLQQHHDTQHRLSIAKSPSIASSRESNQDKRNPRYTQATGVSMSRMKERHRQECRRSMQSPGQQPPPSDTYPSHPSFQGNPLLLQQKKAHPKLQQQRHLIASPSMPSISPIESMPPPLQTLPQQNFPIPAGNPPISYSSPPPPSIARSTSLMTDIHYQQQSTPGGNNGTMAMSPLANDLMQPPPPSWRHQPLFPYQSDIILPPYSPSQLGTFQQPQQQIMQSPYRIKPSLLPRSASVYGNVNQYHYKHYPHDIHHGAMLRSPTMDLNANRKSVPTSTRPYQPQLLSISTQPPLDSKKRHSNTGSISSLQPPQDSLETSASLPAFFSPSTSSPSKGPTSQQQEKTPLSSSASSTISSVCTTPTNIDQKLPAVMRVANDNAKNIDQGMSRQTSSSSKKALDQRETPSSRLKKKHRRQQRRFSLPTTIAPLSHSSSTTCLNKDNSEKDRSDENTIGQKDDLGKLEIGNDPCQHHQATGSPSACSTNNNNNNGMHLCSGGICASVYTAPHTISCCPTPVPSSTPTCQQPHHHHHYPHQQYMDHSYSCAHPPPPPPCCPPPSCCQPRSHHHHHHRHHRKHRHHSASTKQQMRKSKSCMTKAAMEDEDQGDAMTVGSRQKESTQRRRKQHHQSMPASQSMIHGLDEDDDDHTVNGEDETTMKKSPSKPFLRSLLPRAPRFTSLPRTLQDQQQKTRMTTSKSSYSWMPTRA